MIHALYPSVLEPYNSVVQATDSNLSNFLLKIFLSAQFLNLIQFKLNFNDQTYYIWIYVDEIIQKNYSDCLQATLKHLCKEMNADSVQNILPRAFPNFWRALDIFPNA